MTHAPVFLDIALLDGSPEGLWTVEKKFWAGKAVACSRTQFPDAVKLHEFGKPGVYVLHANPGAVGALPQIYIGEADNVGKRIAEHAKSKDFWNRVVIFVGR